MFWLAIITIDSSRADGRCAMAPRFSLARATLRPSARAGDTPLPGAAAMAKFFDHRCFEAVIPPTTTAAAARHYGYQALHRVVNDHGQFVPGPTILGLRFATDGAAGTITAPPREVAGALGDRSPARSWLLPPSRTGFGLRSGWRQPTGSDTREYQQRTRNRPARVLAPASLEPGRHRSLPHLWRPVPDCGILSSRPQAS